jgi:DNA-binding transcriptional LysR family regulator
MSLTIRHVEVFWAVSTVGSVTGAARLLRTSQPTVSRELQRCESLLGLRLFERARGRLRPTAEGLALLDEVKRSYFGLDRITRAAAAIRQFEQGQVSVACPPTFAQTLLPRVCRLFHDQHPRVSIHLHAQDSPILEEWLSAQRYDLGLSDALEPPPGTRTEILASAAEVCVLPPDHPLCAKEVLYPKDFHNVEFVHLAADDPYRMQMDRIFRSAGVERRLTVETPSAEAVCSMVLQGIGVAIINPFTALSYTGRGLNVRRFSAPLSYVLSIVWPEHRPKSQIVEHLAGVLRTVCDEAMETLKQRSLSP